MSRIAFSLTTAVMAVLAFSAGAMAQDKLRATPFGYYEGSAVYGADFMKQSRHLNMGLKAKADFWFVAERSGEKTASIRGEGIATYDFHFGVDFSSVGPAVDMINVLGLKVAPDVKITLDPKTMVQKFTLTGTMSFGDNYENPTLAMQLAFKPIPPGPDAKPDAKPTPAQLVLQVRATIRATGSSGPTVKTIEVDPHNPLGEAAGLGLKKRGEFGPHAVEVESTAGSNADSAFSRRWQAVQKIDYGMLKKIAEMEARIR